MSNSLLAATTVSPLLQQTIQSPVKPNKPLFAATVVSPLLQQTTQSHVMSTGLSPTLPPRNKLNIIKEEADDGNNPMALPTYLHKRKVSTLDDLFDHNSKTMKVLYNIFEIFRSYFYEFFCFVSTVYAYSSRKSGYWWSE
jgi:hypothetical protein